MTASAGLLKRVRNTRRGLAERRDNYFAAVRAFIRPQLNADATWAIDLTEEFGRLDLQILPAFYHGSQEDIALANRLLRRAPMPVVEEHHFNIFNTTILCHHYFVYGDRMDESTKAYCLEMMKEGMHPCPGLLSTDLQFHGYNDNMPAMTVKGLILTGELCEEDDWLAMGRWKLERLAEQLSRCGQISEYNSPNYIPDTIHNLATLHHYVKDTEIKSLTCRILQRLWFDLAAHWCPQGRNPAGPFSRGYNQSFNNLLSSTAGLVWFLFGADRTPLSPHETIAPRPGLLRLHGDDPLEHSARLTWYGTIDDETLSDDVAALFFEKPDRFELRATAEQGHAVTAPLRKTTTTTWIRPDYSLGSASSPFHNGSQTASLYASGCDASGNVSPVLYFRYLMEEAYFPGTADTNTYHSTTTGEVEQRNQGILTTVQQEGSALLSAVPWVTQAGQTVDALRLLLVTPNNLNQFGGWVNEAGEPLKDNEALNADQWFVARLGSSFAAYRPLAYNALGLPASQVSLKRNDQYQVLEVTNTTEKGRIWEAKELKCFLNGGVLEMACASDWQDDPSAFATALREASTFEDQYIADTRRMRYTRSALVDRPKLSLALSYSAGTDGCALRLINGRHAPEPSLSCSGWDGAHPLLDDDDAFESELPFPWTDLSMFCSPKAPWAIHSPS